MKTKLIILLIGIFLVGLVVAGNIINREVNYFNRTQETTLSNVGIDSWSYEDKETADGFVMQRCLTSPSNFNLPCSSWIKTYWENCSEHNITIDYWNETIESQNDSCINPLDCSPIETIIPHNETRTGECLTWDKIYYTTEEKLEMLNAWEEERMKGIADTKKRRDDSAGSVLVNEGDVEVTGNLGL